MRHWLFLFFFPLSFLLVCCTSSRKVSDKNLYYLYKKNVQELHPEYVVYHTSDTTSDLYFKINPQEILYVKSSETADALSSVRITYRLRSSYDSKILIDSASVMVADKFDSNSESIIGKLNFKTYPGQEYLLSVVMKDLNKNTSSAKFLTISKAYKNSKQNFIVLNEQGFPAFKNYINENEKLQILTRNSANQVLFVRYYSRKFPLPAPPFSEVNHKPFSYKADSIFTIQLNDTSKAAIDFNKDGFYHLQSDTSNREGLTIFKFYDDFPEVYKPELLVPPLRFLTSKNEYEDLLANENKKAAVDKFWLDVAGNPARARELLKVYYNRVRDANVYFSSFVEGWKTDRGLIYLIYGAPNAVYRTSNSETWIYGEENNIKSLNFTFIKVVNPFTDNDYSLNRNEFYKDSWYMAVDTWRQGRILMD